MKNKVSALGLDRRFSHDAPLLEELYAAVATEGKAMLGPRVESFERWVARRLGVAHAVGVGSGTGAIMVALRALDIGPGSRVAVPAFGHVAPAAAVQQLGAESVFVDVKDDDLTLDPAAFAKVATRCDAILPVHQFTALADMQALCTLADQHGVHVVEDSAVALGAGASRPAGTWGRAGVFSFHPVKVLGTVGEAGMLVTDDDALAQRCRALRNHGQGAVRFEYDLLGWNTRMDEILAGHLLNRAPRLDALIDRRVQIIQRYLMGLTGLPDIRLPRFQAEDRLAYAMTLRTSRRDLLVAALAEAGIQALVQYPKPMPHCPAFAAHPQARASFPVAEQVGREILSLPTYPELADAEIDRVIEVVRQFAG